MKKHSKKRSKSERETQALLRKISKKAERISPKDSDKKYLDESIISDYSDADISTNSLFQEMKRREF